MVGVKEEIREAFGNYPIHLRLAGTEPRVCGKVSIKAHSLLDKTIKKNQIPRWIEQNLLGPHEGDLPARGGLFRGNFG